MRSIDANNGHVTGGQKVCRCIVGNLKFESDYFLSFELGIETYSNGVTISNRADKIHVSLNTRHPHTMVIQKFLAWSAASQVYLLFGLLHELEEVRK